MPVPPDLSVLHLFDIFNLVKAPAQSLKKIRIILEFRFGRVEKLLYVFVTASSRTSA